MSLAIFPSGVAVAEKPRSVIEDSLASTWAWWNMHQNSGTTLTERTGKTGFTGQTINGTTTNIWSTNPGWFTAAGDNYVAIPQAQADTLFNLRNMTEGGVFIVFTANIGSNPGTGQELFFSYSTGDGTGDGSEYSVYLAFGGNVNLNSSVTNAGGSASTIGGTSLTAEVGNDVVIGAYFDISNSQWSVYANESSATKTKALPTDGTDKPGGWDFGIFGKPGIAGSGARLNAAGSGTIKRDLFAIRFDTDQSSLIPTLMAGFLENSIELPWALEDQ